jgi:diguanylate cyclase (GGDEF)-like protein
MTLTMPSQLDQPSLECAPLEGFLVIGADGAVRSAHPQAEQLIGLPTEIMVGINAFTFFHVDDVPILMSIVSESMMRPGESRAVELRIRQAGDPWRAITLSATNETPRLGESAVSFHLHGPDATVRSADQINREVLHDPVTDLPNRALFIDRVDHAVARNVRRSRPVFVLALGFSGFGSPVGNDRGEASDELVVAVARRLRSCLRASDSVSRTRHDEFAILLEDVTDFGHVKVIADRVIRAMEIPFVDDGVETVLASSIGLASSSPERQRASDLLRAASIARAWASVQGSGGFAEYDPTMAAPEGEEATSQYELDLTGSPSPTAPPLASNGADVSQLSQRLAVLEQAVASLTTSDFGAAGVILLLGMRRGPDPLCDVPFRTHDVLQQVANRSLVPARFAVEQIIGHTRQPALEVPARPPAQSEQVLGLGWRPADLLPPLVNMRHVLSLVVRKAHQPELRADVPLSPDRPGFELIVL